MAVICVLGVGHGWRSLAAEFVQPTIPVTWRPGACDDGFMTPMLPFVKLGNAEIARRRTRPMFTYDTEFLRICLSAEEIDMAAVRLAFARGRPERVRDDDSVSLYLRVADTVHEFTVAADGKLDDVLWERDREDPSWTAAATWSIARPDEWLGYLVIPWKALGIAPQAGARIDFAAIRRARPNNEVSGWPACDDPKAPPTQWGTLLLRGENEPFIGQFIPSRLMPGRCNVVYWLKPDGTRGIMEILADDGGGPRALPLVPKHQGSGGGWWTSYYDLPPGAPLKVQAIMRVGNEVLHATAVLPLPLPLLTGRIEQTQARLAEVRDKAGSVADDGARASFVEACDKLAVELRTLLASVKRAMAGAPSAERAEKLTAYSDHAERCEWRCSILDGRAEALAKGAAASGFGVGTTDSIRKLRRDETALDYGGPLRLRAARRERESGQIVLIPFDAPLRNVKVTWDDLDGPAGTSIAKDDVHVDIVGYVKTTPPDYEVDYVGWWADPLMPLEPFEVPIDHTQPLWVTVYARENAVAGVYQGMVGIDAGDAGAFDVPVRVEVLDYELPLRGKLRTIFGFDWNDRLVRWYRWDTPEFSSHEYKKIPQDWARQVWDMTLSYRIYAGGLYERLPFPREEDIDFCLARGLNNFQVGLAQSPAATKDPDDFLPQLGKVAAVAREKGITDMAYAYGWDEYAEAHPEWRDHYLSDFGAMKKALPDIATANVYGKPTEDVMSVMDIVMPLTPELAHRDRWDYWRDRGHVTGAYVCCGPLHPYANFFIDYPAIDHRVLFWQLYDHRVTFFLYYMTNIWGQSDSQGPRWPDADWVTASHGNDNGDGHLVYPGKSAVLPSVRLANIRDGIEDYEAFAVLDDLTKRLDRDKHADLIAENRKMLSVPDDVTAGLTDYTKDPLLLLDARRRLDDQILKTRKALQ
ncbi:MAG: glycoside hydrolase domain-containing protein [Planctomycetota bacterium]